MDIASELDGLYWGTVLSTLLLGVLIVQGWTYLTTNTDKWPLRLFVIVLLLLDLASTCLSCQVLRYYVLTNYGNPLSLLSFTEPLVAIIAVLSMVAYLLVCVPLVCEDPDEFAELVFFLPRGSIYSVGREIYGLQHLLPCVPPLLWLSSALKSMIVWRIFELQTRRLRRGRIIRHG